LSFYVEPAGVLTHQDHQELSSFLDQSVQPSTGRAYDRHWALWKTFLQAHLDLRPVPQRGIGGRETRRTDPFHLQAIQRKLRYKQATAPTAGVRLAFAHALLSTDFFDHPSVTSARQECRRKPEELRARRDAGAEGIVKLPV
jgi:hypothetical protein